MSSSSMQKDCKSQARHRGDQTADAQSCQDSRLGGMRTTGKDRNGMVWTLSLGPRALNRGWCRQYQHKFDAMVDEPSLFVSDVRQFALVDVHCAQGCSILAYLFLRGRWSVA